MKTLFGAVAVLGLSATVAGATGGFDCTIADDNLDFTVSAGISHGMGGAILGYEAAGALKMAGVPEALRKPDLSGGMVHHWLDYPELRLHFYAETQGDAPFSSMELVIETEAVEGDDPAYEGEYWLAVFVGEDGSGIEAGGSVSCSGE